MHCSPDDFPSSVVSSVPSVPTESHDSSHAGVDHHGEGPLSLFLVFFDFRRDSWDRGKRMAKSSTLSKRCAVPGMREQQSASYTQDVTIQTTYRRKASSTTIHKLPDPKGRDAAEVQVTKNAMRLNLPIFVILPGARSSSRRTVKLGWVKDYDDDGRLFLILFGETEPPCSV
jgi:hypothetical protein